MFIYYFNVRSTICQLFASFYGVHQAADRFLFPISTSVALSVSCSLPFTVSLRLTENVHFLFQRPLHYPSAVCFLLLSLPTNVHLLFQRPYHYMSIVRFHLLCPLGCLQMFISYFNVRGTTNQLFASFYCVHQAAEKSSVPISTSVAMSVSCSLPVTMSIRLPKNVYFPLLCLCHCRSVDNCLSFEHKLFRQSWAFTHSRLFSRLHFRFLKHNQQHQFPLRKPNMCVSSWSVLQSLMHQILVLLFTCIASPEWSTASEQ